MIPVKLADLTNPGTLASMTKDQIAPLILKLAAIQSALASRLLDSTEKTDSRNGDKLLEVKEAAAKLSVTEDWLYRKGDKLPFVVRMGRNIRFSEQGIEKYIRQRTGH